MPYKTKFVPLNKEKYVGDVEKIMCKSLWERKLCKYLDIQDSVIKWCYECVKIPYMSPIDKKKHTYYPDFMVMLKEKTGEIKTIIVEVKPEKQTKEPANKKKKSYKNELVTFLINEAKWKAAKEYALDRKQKFIILTEKDLGISK